MKNSTLRLVLTAAASYYAVLFLVLSFYPPGVPSSPVVLLSIPLLVLFVILASDLSHRATEPTEAIVRNYPSRTMAREVQELTRNIEVGSRASDQFFENILLARLREVLVEKVTLETGLDPQRVRGILSNPRLGPGFLRNDSLYKILYGPSPGRGPGRVKLLAEATGLVEAWKP